MKRFVINLILLFFIPITIGQVYTPIANSRFAGVYSVCYNPANAASSKYKIHVNIIGAGLNVNNNFVALNLPYSPYRFLFNNVSIKYKNPDGSYKIDKTDTRLLNLSSPVHSNAGLVLLGPSILIKFNSFAIGLTTNATALARINFLDRKLATAAYYKFKSTDGAFNLVNKELASGNSTIIACYGQGLAYTSLGISLAKEYVLKWNSKLYIGVTPKITKGIRFESLNIGEVSIKTLGLDSLVVSPVNATFYSSNQGKIGRGLDFGISYEHQKPGPKQSGKYRDNQTNYHSKWGLAILNIGSLSFNTKQIIAKSTGNLTYTNNITNPVNGNNDTLLLQFARRYGRVTQRTETIKVGLPTMLNLSADYQLNPKWYLSVNWLQSLRSRKSIHGRIPSSLMIAPRVELKNWELGFPVSLLYDYRAPRAGFYVRYTYFHIGSHHILNYFNLRNAREIDLFFGLCFGIKDKSQKKKNAKEESDKEKGKGKDKCVEF